MLLDDIIDILGSKDGSITEALLKTKIVLHELGHKELVGWLNKELNGYTEDDDVPPYRILGGRLMGNITTGYVRYPSHQLPMLHLTESEQERFSKNLIRESLSVVQSLSEAEGGVMRPIPPEYGSRLAKGLAEGFHVEQAWIQIRAQDVANVVFQVRTRLLDFMLDLRDKVGSGIKDKDLKDKANDVDAASLFNKAFFGGTTTIIIGNNNTQKIAIKDNAELVAELTRLFVGAGGKLTTETAANLNKVAELAEAGKVDQARPLLRQIFDFAGDGVKNTAWGVLGSYIAKILGVG